MVMAMMVIMSVLVVMTLFVWVFPPSPCDPVLYCTVLYCTVLYCTNELMLRLVGVTVVKES